MLVDKSIPKNIEVQVMKEQTKVIYENVRVRDFVSSSKTLIDTKNELEITDISKNVTETFGLCPKLDPSIWFLFEIRSKILGPAQICGQKCSSYPVNHMQRIPRSPE